ncbi:MAG: hypothetical protein GXZ04_06020 [Clostridiales bacterium]|nr:hypothetical protein [Clostridiales bacterium]
MRHPIRNKRPSLRLLALAAALVLAIPFGTLATTADIPEYGVTVGFPASLDVFTKNMADDNPVLALYDTTANQVREDLSRQGLTAKAQDIAGKFFITLALTSQSGEDLGTLDEASLKEFASRYGGEVQELIPHRSGSFLLMKNEEARQITCVFLGGNLLYELRLYANGRLRSSMSSIMKDIARLTEFSLGQ